MNNQKKVSVIVPFCNNAKYIRRCVESLLSQTYSNIDIILVNNASTDNFLEEISDLITDERVVLLEEPQRGVSTARNKGINQSKGEYIVFVDGDDYVESDYVETLVGLMGDNVELGVCGYSRVDEDSNIITTDNENNGVIKTREFLSKLFGVDEEEYNGFVWNKIFLSRIIKNNNIQFDPEIIQNEDRLFVINYILNTGTNGLIKRTSKKEYYYVQRPDSATNKLREKTNHPFRMASDIRAFDKCERLLSDYRYVREQIVDESVEKAIIFLRHMKKDRKESKYIATYLRRIRKKYNYYLSKLRKIQILSYEGLLSRQFLLWKNRKQITKSQNEQPSIKKNFFYNTGYKILTYIIPLITAPYTARIFGADGTGIQSFTGSVSAYFVLFATLGTVSYGMREIAMCRDDKKKRSKTFWEIELLSIATTSVCLVAWIVLIIFSEKYTPYYVVLTMNIIGVAFDISWFFSGLENYKLIVIRNTIFRLIGVAILFLVVREKSDLLLYWALTAASGLIGNISLWFALPRHLVKVPFKNMHFKKHLKETMVYFVPTIATTVYTVLDKTMIGVITKDTKENGYYEQTNKLVTMALSLLMSFNIVMNTRMSYLFANKKIKEMKERLTKSIDFSLWLAVPMTAGFIGIAKRFVPFFYGPGYDKVITLLYVYSPLIIIIAISNCLAEQFLIPTGKIRKNSIAVMVGALVNLCCNVFLITYFKSVGAAIASIIAETVITCIIVYYSRTMMVWKTILKKMWKRIIAAIPMVIVVSIIGRVNISAVFVVSMQIIVGIGIYFLTLIILKDNSTKEYFNYYINKVKKRVKRS